MPLYSSWGRYWQYSISLWRFVSACNSFQLRRDFLGVLIHQPRSCSKKAKYKQIHTIQIDIVNAAYCFILNEENVCHSYCCEILSSLGLVQDPLKSVEKKPSINNEGLWIRPRVSWTNGQLLQKWIKVLKKPNSTKCHIDILLLLWHPSLLEGKKKY